MRACIEVMSGEVFEGIGRSTLLKLIFPSSFTRTKKRRAILWACESGLLGALIGVCGLGWGGLIDGSGAVNWVTGSDGRLMLIVV